MKALDDTICAIATPKGEGGIGIVRLSGSQAIHIASQNVRVRHHHDFKQLSSYRLYLAQFCGALLNGLNTQPTPQQTVLDEILVVIMRAPRSYTGEDIVEFHCHGGPMVVSAVCESLLISGARLADPGEFTRRAFLNGKLDLTQAEAVLDTIHSTSLESLKLAQEQLRGTLGKRLQTIKDSLVRAIAHLEAGMDFVDEDIQFVDSDELKKEIQTLILRVTELIESAKEGRIIREGIRTVLMGKPNVGKSSLLNALLGVDRAIVSHIPGTTRDVLEESMTVEGILVRFCDTAGLRDSPDELETEGIHRAMQVINDSDVAILVFDRSLMPNEKDLEVILKTKEKKQIIALNKSDLPPKFSRNVAEEMVHNFLEKNGSLNGIPKICEVSAITGLGLDDLKRIIKKSAVGNGFESSENVLVTKMRHVALLKEAREALQYALSILQEGITQECLAMELRTALQAIAEIIGEVTNEDILDQVFRDFCIGK